VPGSGDGPRTFDIPWSLLGNPTRFTGIAFQNDGSATNQLTLFNLMVN
jgi:hypothetical protein